MKKESTSEMRARHAQELVEFQKDQVRNLFNIIPKLESIEFYRVINHANITLFKLKKINGIELVDQNVDFAELASDVFLGELDNGKIPQNEIDKFNNVVSATGLNLHNFIDISLVLTNVGLDDLDDTILSTYEILERKDFI